MREFLLLFCITILSSCALPVPEGRDLGGFVSDQELVSVQIIREGMDFYDSSRYLDAELRFRQAVYLNPGLPNLMLNLAAALDKQGQYEEAFAIYDTLLEKDPKNIQFLSGKARVYLSAGHQYSENYQKAIEYYGRALDAAYDLNDVASIANIAKSLSVLYFKIGNEEEALCYAATVYLNRPAVDDFIRFSKMFIALGKLNEAIEVISKYATENSADTNPGILHEKSMAAYGLGQFDLAQKLERRGLLTGGIDPALRAEMNLVKNLSVNELVASGVPSSEKLEEDEWEDFLDTLKNFSEANSAVTLYWPPRLVEKVTELWQLSEVSNN